MNGWRQLKTEKGFTLIELMAVLAILAIIVAIAVPAVGSILAKSQVSAEKSSIELMERAGELAHLDGLDFETAGTPTERYAIPTLVSEGYLKLETDSPFYASENYVVKQSNGTFVYNGEVLVDEAPSIPDSYVLAGDSDFTFTPDTNAPNTYGNTKGFYRYTGTHTHVMIPETIKGHRLRDYHRMFTDTTVEEVISDNTAITNMSQMFQNSKATALDLSHFDTSNVTNMSAMFHNSQAKTIDLNGFDTSNVTTMHAMFHSARATTLNLSGFDTSNVTTMSAMFNATQITTLDLSSFDTSKVTSIDFMFHLTKVTTGYAKTQADANKFNNSSSYKPAALKFIVK